MSLKINPISFKAQQPQQQKYFLTPPATTKPAENNHTSDNALKIIAALSLASTAGLSIVTFNKMKNIKTLEQIISSQSEKLPTQVEEKIMPYVVKSFEETSLYTTYKESSKGFIDFIKTTRAPEQVKEFLFAITADENVSAKFIREATENPRDSFKNVEILTNAIGGEKNLVDWLHGANGYNKAYAKYIKNIEKDSNTTLDDLIRISPNWHLYKLLDKTSVPNEFGENTIVPQNIRFGKIPEEFAKLGDLRHFNHWLDSAQHSTDIVEFSGQYMKLKPLKPGLSMKSPILIEFCTPEGVPVAKLFVLKKEPVHHDLNTNIYQAYQSDSNFIDAQIDYYLNMHNCENSVKFHFFDFDSNIAVYDFVKGENYTGTTNIIELNKRMKDLNRLGIFYNDTNQGNFIVQNGILKIIDSGEAMFQDVLKPSVPVLHFELPNWCGNRVNNLTLNKIFGSSEK